MKMKIYLDDNKYIKLKTEDGEYWNHFFVEKMDKLDFKTILFKNVLEKKKLVIESFDISKIMKAENQEEITENACTYKRDGTFISLLCDYDK